jgi:ubiquitin carboxyl-terminal hydrolase 7
LQKYPREQIRPWPFAYRSNETHRPTFVDIESESAKTIIDLADNNTTWNIFLETLKPDSDLSALRPFDKDSDVLLFFKQYDPKTKQIRFCGHQYMPVAAKVGT